VQLSTYRKNCICSRLTQAEGSTGIKTRTKYKLFKLADCCLCRLVLFSGNKQCFHNIASALICCCDANSRSCWSKEFCKYVFYNLSGLWKIIKFYRRSLNCCIFKTFPLQISKIHFCGICKCSIWNFVISQFFFLFMPLSPVMDGNASFVCNSCIPINMTIHDDLCFFSVDNILHCY